MEKISVAQACDLLTAAYQLITDSGHHFVATAIITADGEARQVNAIHGHGPELGMALTEGILNLIKDDSESRPIWSAAICTVAVNGKLPVKVTANTGNTAIDSLLNAVYAPSISNAPQKNSSKKPIIKSDGNIIEFPKK